MKKTGCHKDTIQIGLGGNGRKYQRLIFSLALGLFLFLWGCIPAQGPGGGNGSEKDSVPVLTKHEYSVTRLPRQCRWCHQKEYDMVDLIGNGHRINCIRCHRTYHLYVANKTRHKQLSARCSPCHKGCSSRIEKLQVDLTNCKSCHIEVHAPSLIPIGPALERNCQACHEKQDRELKTFITRHTQLSCPTCHHTWHNYSPLCTECHRSHELGGATVSCEKCHCAHKVKKIVFPEHLPGESCRGCHRGAYKALDINNTKHQKLSCLSCHPGRHGTVTRCGKCHQDAHRKKEGETLHSRYRLCGRCHGQAHNLVKDSKKPLGS